MPSIFKTPFIHFKMNVYGIGFACVSCLGISICLTYLTNLKLNKLIEYDIKKNTDMLDKFSKLEESIKLLSNENEMLLLSHKTHIKNYELNNIVFQEPIKSRQQENHESTEDYDLITKNDINHFEVLMSLAR